MLITLETNLIPRPANFGILLVYYQIQNVVKLMLMLDLVSQSQTREAGTNADDL